MFKADEEIRNILYWACFFSIFFLSYHFFPSSHCFLIQLFKKKNSPNKFCIHTVENFNNILGTIMITLDQTSITEKHNNIDAYFFGCTTEELGIFFFGDDSLHPPIFYFIYFFELFLYYCWLILFKCQPISKWPACTSLTWESGKSSQQTHLSSGNLRRFFHTS